MSRPAAFLATAAFAAVLFHAGSASAQNCDTAPPMPTLALDSGDTLKCGLQYIGTMTLGGASGQAGTIRVEPYDPGVPGSGWLHIKANSIDIRTTGVIDANHAGYRGSSLNNAPDRGPGPGGVVPAIFDMPPLPAPGGGGAAAGNGGQGSDNCTAVAGAEGGLAYITSMDLGDFDMLMGSAGGASRSATNDYIGRGGHGGGVIILEAHTIHIEGELHASGEAGLTTNGAGPGGGGGGTIVLLANNLSFGADAVLFVRGGNGGVAQAIYGAGGGGGLILVSAEGDLSGQLVDPLASVAGGQGAAACCDVSGMPFACGAPGIIEQTSMTPPCIDADGDGAPTEACGGTDCDDANPQILPMGDEICDGLDNDCNGDIDEDPAGDLCPAGFICEDCSDGMMGCVIACVPVDPGTGAGGGAGQDQYLRLGGGLCASTGSRGGRTLLWLLAAMLGSLAARRRLR